MQGFLYRLENCCQDYQQSLCVSKCSIISFFRSGSPIITDYLIDIERLFRVSSIRDLGVILVENLTFKEHTEYVIGRANKSQRLIFRITSEFTRMLKIVLLLHRSPSP